MASQPREIYTRFRESMLSKTDDWVNLLADHATLKGPLAQVEGKEKFIEVNRPFFASIRGGELHEVVEDGDRIITRISTEVQLPMGKSLTLEVCEWYEVAEGKIVSLRVYFDTAEFLREMQPPA